MRTLLLTLAIFLVMAAVESETNNICFATDYTQDPYCQGAWLFEEGAGVTVEDASANANTGYFKASGQPPWSTDTPTVYSTYCVDFDGSNDYVNVGSHSSLDNINTFTYLFWVKPEGTPGWAQGGILEKGAHSQSRKAIRDDDIGSGSQDILSCRVDYSLRDANSRSSKGEIADGSWHHCAITFNNSGDKKIRIYKNGSEINYSSQRSGYGSIVTDASYDFFIGGTPPSAFYAFNGKVDEVAIFSRVLSLTEINEIMLNGLKPASTPNQAPTAIIDSISPNPAEQGEVVTFNGHGTDSDGTISAYNWCSSIDGQLSTNSSFNTSTLSANTHTIYFKVQDNDAAWSNEVSQTLTITAPANQPPTAIIDSITPNPAEQGEVVSFTGHGTDSDGTISAYSWRSNIDGQLSTNSSFNSSSLSANTHTIYFKVQDNDAAWSNEVSQTLTITTANQAPTAIIDSISPNPAEQGETVTFTGHGTDTDGWIDSYFWDFGDGYNSTQQDATHTYESAGNYTVQFTVTDNEAAIGYDQLLMMVTAPITPTWQVPQLLRFQGRLTDPDGLSLDGSYDMTFRMYDAEVEGNLLWSETYSQETQIEVNKGIFSVLLGSITPLELSFDQDYWLSTEVDNDGEMSPRQRISSVGYACRAETVNKGPMVYTGQGEVKIGATETLYFYLEAKPKSIIFYLWGEASTQGSYPDNLNIMINGQDQTQNLLAQANLNWGTQETGLGDGTSSHPLVIGAGGVSGSGALQLSSLDNFSEGEQKLTVTQTGPGSGKIRYNLYIKY